MKEGNLQAEGIGWLMKVPGTFEKECKGVCSCGPGFVGGKEAGRTVRSGLEHGNLVSLHSG